MTKSVWSKTALVALLVGAALVGSRSHTNAAPLAGVFALALLIFGIVNVVVSTPGTRWVRAIAVGTVFGALLWPAANAWVLLFAWLAWPPAFVASWALARNTSAPATESEEAHQNGTAARIAVASLIGAVAIASLLYRLLVAHNLEQTAALFIGIPALLAIVVVFAVRPESVVGVACKAVTVGLLVSLLFLGEGVVCVVMSAPLFYAIAVAIGSSMEWAHRRHEKSDSTLFSCFILLAIVPMSLEGVTSITTLNRDEAVSASKIVHAPAVEVERALFAAPRFDRQRPFLLRAGFPAAVASRIERQGREQHWVVQVRGGETRLNGMEPRTGNLVLALEDARPGLVRWRALSDSSHTTHFLDWRESIVQWEPIDAQTTRVSWTLTYRRGLDPAWYFGPMERYAAGLAAGYLIDVVATP